MAALEITPVKGEFNKITDFDFKAAETASEGITFKLPKTTDEYLVVLVQNTGDSQGKITLKAPAKGSYAASDSDEEHNIIAGGFSVIRLESARFANTDGTVLLVPSDVSVKVAVLY